MRAPAESSSQTAGCAWRAPARAGARTFSLAGHAHRPGHDGEVVGGDGDEPAVDLAVAGDDAVGGRLLPSIARCEKCGRPWTPSSTKVPVVDQQVERARARSASRAACCLAIFSSPPPSAIVAPASSSSTSGASAAARPAVLAAVRVCGRLFGRRHEKSTFYCAHSTDHRPSTPAPASRRSGHALDDVLGRQRQRELRAQVVERVGEGHVQLAEHRVLAEPHDQRRLARELLRPVAHRGVELVRRHDAVDEPVRSRLPRGRCARRAAAARWSSCAARCGRSAP